MQLNAADFPLLCDTGLPHGRQLLTPLAPSRHWSGLAGLCLRARESSWGDAHLLLFFEGSQCLLGVLLYMAAVTTGLLPFRRSLARTCTEGSTPPGAWLIHCRSTSVKQRRSGSESRVGLQQTAQNRLFAYPAGVSCKPVSVYSAFQHHRDAACTVHSRNHPTQIVQLPLEPLSSVLSSAGPVVCGSQLQTCSAPGASPASDSRCGVAVPSSTDSAAGCSAVPSSLAGVLSLSPVNLRLAAGLISSALMLPETKVSWLQARAAVAC